MSSRWIETWSFRRIVEAVAGESTVAAQTRIELTSVSTDTRTLEQGALFVALVGDNFDGHAFVRAAELKGASAAIVSEPLDVDLPLIVVEDTLVALQDLSRAVFASMQSRPDVRTIAITGSNGKTTTKEYVRAIIGDAAYATPGNLNNHIGLPLTILNAPASSTKLVLEMGANKPGDIAELIGIAPTDVRVITSIGDAHLEGFGSRDGVLHAKSEIFRNMRSGNRAVVTSEVASLLDAAGIEPDNLEVVGPAGSFRYNSDGNELRWTWNQTSGVVINPLDGIHNQSNLAVSLAAAMFAVPEGLVENVQARLDGMQLPDGRSRVVEKGAHLFFDDAYNANPSSIQASFQTWLDAPSTLLRVAIVGEVFELGSRARELHLEIARDVATRIAACGDSVTPVFVGSYASEMAAEAGATALGFETVEAAAKWLQLQSKSHVFLKGSRGMKMERIIELMDE